jgi:hypothetical protein
MCGETIPYVTREVATLGHYVKVLVNVLFRISLFVLFILFCFVFCSLYF